jgi:YggT family protein
MGYAWVSIINMLVQLVTWGVIIHVILGIFLGPFHPAREFTARLIEPLLAPIRQMLPQSGMMDFSPMVLIILVQLLGRFFISLF